MTLLNTPIAGSGLLRTPPLPSALPDTAPGRAADDRPAIRRAIFDKALTTVTGLAPIKSGPWQLSVTDPYYEGPDNVTEAEYKQAVLTGGSLGRRLRGTLTLSNHQTGQPVAQRKMTLAHIPYYTDSGTFVDNGSAYTIAHQTRLKAGSFTRRKANGELETQVNVLPGQGVPHRIWLEPKTGLFRIRIGQANVPLIPLLKATGITDEQIEEAWGSELAAVNRRKVTAGDLPKLYQRLVRNGTATTPREQMEQIRDAMLATRLDPKVSQRTLGIPAATITPETMLLATRKLLAINNKNNPEVLEKLKLDPADPDDRDHLAFMRLLGPEDMIAERLSTAHRLLRPLLWKAAAKGTLDNVPAGILDKAVRSVLLESGLAQPSEEINPLQVYDQSMRVSRLGTGGIPSADAIPESSRNVQASAFGFIDPIITPESMNAGVDTRLTRNIRKGPDGEIYGQFHDPKTGKTLWKQPDELFDTVIAFPGELKRAQQYQQQTGEEGVIRVMHKGRERLTPASRAELELPFIEKAFSPAANMVPLKSGMKAHRVAMGARMQGQAVSLVQPEAPLVRSGIPDGDGSYEKLYGTVMGAVRAARPGVVEKVDDTGVHVRYDDGKAETIGLANYRPFNRKTYLHQTPTVQPGQRFEADQLLARSNYTDDQGVSALGRNARVAYLAARGTNYEDAIAISESFAKKNTSTHMYQHSVDLDPAKDQLSKKRFLGAFPGEYNKTQLQGLDDDGIVKIGQRVEYGDPMVLVARQQAGRFGEVSRARATSFRNQTETWEHHNPGIVTDVAKTKHGVVVTVRTESAMAPGDKLANRFGGKGVVNVIPDDEMPIGEDGKPFEVLLNPYGLISRANPNQAVEAWLGKIAAKTGKPYDLKDFQDMGDLWRFAKTELAKHGMSGTETLTDPKTGRKIPGVATGVSYMLKLHHQAEGKLAGRGFGAYSQDEVPAKGGPEGSKTWGMLAVNALMSHGATAAALDASALRGQRNPDYWAAVMSGRTPAEPAVPFVYRKFLNMLRGAGMHPVQEGTKMHIMALSNSEIKRLTGDRTVQAPDTVDWDDETLKPIAGGLFDEKLFGGAQGERLWAKIDLPEPMPSPVMEEPIRKLLGLTRQQFDDVIAGKHKLHGQSGPSALKAALARIDVDREIKQAEIALKSGRKTARDNAVRKLGFLLGSKKTGVPPVEWMWDAVPVLPPAFRPVNMMTGSNVPLVADANFLYRDVFELGRNLKDAKAAQLDPGEERLALYQGLKAVTGLGEPVAKRLQDQNVKGLLRHIFGSGGPKTGMVQRRLLGSATDLVGRGVVLPNPNLDMDSVAIPEAQAFSVYKPFVVRRLVQQGMSPLKAATLTTEQAPLAKQALLEEMKVRPVFLDRSPILHRYGVMAFWPRLAAGDAIETSPLVNKPYGMDHDGDALQFSVPGTDEAVKDAIYKMMPSRNLLAVSSFKPHFIPQQEFLGGLHAASTAKSDRRPVVFATRQDALKAIRRGELDLGQAIQLLDPQ